MATGSSGSRWTSATTPRSKRASTAVFARAELPRRTRLQRGLRHLRSVEETPLDRARAQLETNFFGVLRVLTPVLARMRERDAGRILLVGSLAGRAPIPFQAHYSASKAAIEALAFALANEVEPFDVSTCQPDRARRHRHEPSTT